MSDIQRQVLNCPECQRSFRFNLDFELDGNHGIICPGCGHVHYRVIINGRITEERYNLNPRYATYAATGYSMSSTSASTNSDWDTGGTASGATSTGTGDTFLRHAWMNSTSTY